MKMSRGSIERGRCRQAAVAMLTMRRVGLDRFVMRYIAQIVWATRCCEYWNPMIRIETETTIYRTRDPIKLFSFEIDGWRTFDEEECEIKHIRRHAYRLGFSIKTGELRTVTFYKFIDEVFLVTKINTVAPPVCPRSSSASS